MSVVHRFYPAANLYVALEDQCESRNTDIQKAALHLRISRLTPEGFRNSNHGLFLKKGLVNNYNINLNYFGKKTAYVLISFDRAARQNDGVAGTYYVKFLCAAIWKTTKQVPHVEIETIVIGLQIQKLQDISRRNGGFLSYVDRNRIAHCKLAPEKVLQVCRRRNLAYLNNIHFGKGNEERINGQTPNVIQIDETLLKGKKCASAGRLLVTDESTIQKK
ncbi:hypothetical protein RF11_14327 [Thelohanellus kitauei]|uniref:Uncharacterized protein n=1 Tax=Thelohanellus kitauei TaxID=669202 RepID=A0A0C2JEC2_THEKT|nr:hypothetical protein RF11_14327 [Thelohanellus kitauei]